MAAESSHGLSLETFSRSTPPGWKPNMSRYPLRRYLQLLRLWWRTTDVPEHASGPAIAGRLRGTAFQLALSLSADRYDPDTGQVRHMVGDDLLAQPAT